MPLNESLKPKFHSLVTITKKRHHRYAPFLYLYKMLFNIDVKLIKSYYATYMRKYLPCKN